MKFKNLLEYDITSKGMTQGEDKEWVMKALQFWKEQKIKHPRAKRVAWEVEQFEKMAKKFQ